VVDNQGELVSAHAGYGVGAAQALLNALRSLDQQQVPGFVAQRVVHFLEVVQVHKYDCEFGIDTLAARQGFLQPGAQHAAVG